MTGLTEVVPPGPGGCDRAGRGSWPAATATALRGQQGRGRFGAEAWTGEPASQWHGFVEDVGEVLVVTEVVGEDVDLETGDALDLVREPTEIEQRCRGGQVDQQVDVTVFGVLPAHRGAEDADVVEVETLRLVEDRVGVDGERDARAGVLRFEDPPERLLAWPLPSALVRRDGGLLHAGGGSETGLREAEVFAGSADQLRSPFDPHGDLPYSSRL